jgi:hypothetical protein
VTVRIPATHPRAHRRHLAQRQNGRPGTPVPHRLRPLNPWHRSSSIGGTPRPKRAVVPN